MNDALDEQLRAVGFTPTLAAGRWWRASDGALVLVDGDIRRWDPEARVFVPFVLVPPDQGSLL